MEDSEYKIEKENRQLDEECCHVELQYFSVCRQLNAKIKELEAENKRLREAVEQTHRSAGLASKARNRTLRSSNCT